MAHRQFIHHCVVAPVYSLVLPVENSIYKTCMKPATSLQVKAYYHELQALIEYSASWARFAQVGESQKKSWRLRIVNLVAENLLQVEQLIQQDSRPQSAQRVKQLTTYPLPSRRPLLNGSQRCPAGQACRSVFRKAGIRQSIRSLTSALPYASTGSYRSRSPTYHLHYSVLRELCSSTGTTS